MNATWPEGSPRAQLLPRLPCRCFARDRRCAACGSPRLVRHEELGTLAIAPRRLRRFLRHDRKARRPLARGRTGHRRRRQARRGGGCLLRRPHVRGQIGNADVRGVAAMSAGESDPAEHGEICQSRPRGAPDDAGFDAAGRAAVDRRGVSRSERHRAAARPVAGQGAGALRCRSRKEARASRVSIGLSGNKFLAKIASDLDKPRGFAVLGAREAPAFLAPKPVGFIFGVGKVERRAAFARRLSPDRRPADRRAKSS